MNLNAENSPTTAPPGTWSKTEKILEAVNADVDAVAFHLGYQFARHNLTRTEYLELQTTHGVSGGAALRMWMDKEILHASGHAAWKHVSKCIQGSILNMTTPQFSLAELMQFAAVAMVTQWPFEKIAEQLNLELEAA